MITLNRKAGTFMSGNSTPFASKKIFRHLIHAAVLLISIVTSAPRTYAQEFIEVDIAEFYYGLNYLGLSGDTMKFQFDLGSQDLPADNVAGYDLVFTFPNLNSAPTTTLVRVESTWLAAGLHNPVPVWAFAPEDNALAVNFLRSDQQGVTGFGTIVHIYLLRTNGFTKDEAAMNLNDGVVLVENIDLRLGQSPTLPIGSVNDVSATVLPQSTEVVEYLSPKSSFSVYPNPTSDFIEVKVADSKGCTMRLWSLNGQLLKTQPCREVGTLSTEAQRLDLSNLPKGNYFLSVDSDGSSGQQMIVRN